MITFILIGIWGCSFKLNLRSSIIRRHLLHLSSWLYFILGEIIFVTRVSIKWNLCSHISLLWDRLGFNFRWFNILRFVCGYTLKFDGRSVDSTWHGSISGFEYIAILLWIKSRLNNIWFILIFIGTLANKRNLI